MNEEALKRVENKDFSLSMTFPTAYYEMDLNAVLKPSAMMNFLQDLATKSAELLGFGPSFIFPKNYAWFLVKYRMEFDEYPCALDEIVIKTEARGYSKIIASRDFEILTPEGKRLGRVASNWMLIDLANKNVLPLAKAIDYMPILEKREGDLVFEKIKPIERVDFEKVFEIRFDDIDVNQHVNNANYIVWAFEALPYEFNSTKRLKTLDVVYKKEIAYGASVLSQAELEGDVSTHVLKNAQTGEELCFVHAVWG